jgi:hypothetical protein
MLLIIIALASPQAGTGPLMEMTEDSGAFKTIPAVFVPRSGICDDPAATVVTRSHRRRKHRSAPRRIMVPTIF